MENYELEFRINVNTNNSSSVFSNFYISNASYGIIAF